MMPENSPIHGIEGQYKICQEKCMGFKTENININTSGKNRDFFFFATSDNEIDARN